MLARCTQTVYLVESGPFIHRLIIYWCTFFSVNSQIYIYIYWTMHRGLKDMCGFLLNELDYSP